MATRPDRKAARIMRRTASAQWLPTGAPDARAGFDAFCFVGTIAADGCASARADWPHWCASWCCSTFRPPTMYERTNMDFARLYYHWFSDPASAAARKIDWSRSSFLPAHQMEVGAQRGSTFRPTAIADTNAVFTSWCGARDVRGLPREREHRSEHDRTDTSQKIECPLHVLWVNAAFHRVFTPISIGRKVHASRDRPAVACGHTSLKSYRMFWPPSYKRF